jgi:hypothetical protein
MDDLSKNNKKKEVAGQSSEDEEESRGTTFGKPVDARVV